MCSLEHLCVTGEATDLNAFYKQVTTKEGTTCPFPEFRK